MSIAIADQSREGSLWQYRAGDMVETHRYEQFYRRGRVDDAIPDGSGLWISAQGPIARELIWRDEGFSVRMMHAHTTETSQGRPEEGEEYPIGSPGGYPRDLK
ncbi:hypothetical protein LFT45_04685 [Arthrobacter sp. FW305-BF8]|uniref:hypothetical protein n=1 Tax=Arthrobacter sp. FW305-BF8 TaxID=2879617 RepID=UPI001F216D52|nr:hypothetical protein [Arthrobacter sp. FW305-BF8]UKA55228.1 hypothetical protein LFT45_04685 [Arthrobacter sp. FW305-BF8]